MPVLHRPEVVDIGVYTVYGLAICLKDYRLQSFLSIQYGHGDLCKHLGIDSSADLDDRYSNLDDRYSNLFLNAYINRHVHDEFYIVLTPISTTSGL